VDIHEMNSWQTVLENLNQLLKKQFDILHVTLQPEPDIMNCKPCGVASES